MAVSVKDTALWEFGLSDFTASRPEEEFFVLDLNQFGRSFKYHLEIHTS